MELDVAVGVSVGGGAVLVSGLRGEISTGAGVCASWVVQVCAFQVGVFRSGHSWFPFFDGLPHHVKVIHSGRKDIPTTVIIFIHHNISRKRQYGYLSVMFCSY
jgi:hypothetical protein